MADTSTSSFMLREAKLRSGEQFAACARAAADMDITPTFSHSTALRYQGVAVPDDCTLPAGLHISFENRGARRRFDGTHTHYWSGDFQTTFDEGGGFFVTNPAMTWAQMAAYVSEESLAVIGGAYACRDEHRRMASLDDLARYVRDNPYFHGCRRCKDILPFLLENSDSPPESAVAVLIMKSGLGTPIANFRIELPAGGYRLGDLAFPELKLVIEYQGAYHAGLAQMRADADRWNELRALGWDIVFVTVDDLRTEHAKRAIVALIRAAMERQKALLGLMKVL